MRGTKRLRGSSWQLRAYAGIQSDGTELRISETIPPRQTPKGPVPVPEREADEALAKLIARAARLRDGGTAPRRSQKQKRVTVREGFEAWRDYARPHLEPNGADTDGDVLNNYVYPHLGGVELWRLRSSQKAAPGDIDYDPDVVSLTAFYAQLATSGTAGRRRKDGTLVGAGKPLSPSTIRRVHGVVRRALDYCVDRGWIAANPAIGARMPAVVKRRSTMPTTDVLAKFIGFLEENDPETLVFVDLMNSGARRVDMGVQWGDLSVGAEGGGAIAFGLRGLIQARDETGKVVTLVRDTPTRKRRPRTVALDAATVSHLLALRVKAEAAAALCGVRLAPTAFVFSTEPDGLLPRPPQWFSGAFRYAKKRAARAGIAGLERVRPYDLRHFHISQLLAHGESPAVVAERAGNSQRTMDAFYRHAVPARDQAAAELMARILREAAT